MMSIVMIPEVPAAKNTGVSFCKSAVKYAHYLQAAATKSTSQGIVCLSVRWNTTRRYLQPRAHHRGLPVSMSVGTPPGGTCNQEHIARECQSVCVG